MVYANYILVKLGGKETKKLQNIKNKQPQKQLILLCQLSFFEM